MQLHSPIFYLEQDNFDTQFKLKPIQNPLLQTPTPLFHAYTIIMIQGNYCGYCTKLKPIFQQIANEVVVQTPDIHFATIQIDEQQTEKTISSTMLKNILQFDIPGVPVVVKFFQGRPMDMYKGSHNKEELHQWILS